MYTIQWKTYDGDTPISLGAFTNKIVAREVAERFHDHLIDTNHSWKSYEVTVTPTTNTEKDPNWIVLLEAVTGAEFYIEDSGGGHEGYEGRWTDGIGHTTDTYLYITNEELTTPIAPDEPVMLGVYTHENMEPNSIQTFPTMTELITHLMDPNICPICFEQPTNNQCTCNYCPDCKTTTPRTLTHTH